MSVVGSSNILAGASGQGGFTIEESLRFNSSQSSYLSWTPASAGNLTTWTFSCWFKRGSLSNSNNQTLLWASGGAAEDGIRIVGTSGAPDTDKINFYIYNGGYVAGQFSTTQLFRDPSAWYHLIWVWDTTNATSTDRIRLYINGERVTSFSASAYPSLNAQSGAINRAYQHEIGRQTNSTARVFDGYLTEVNFIDGQALDPSSFGEFDSVTGVWKPAKYTGTYGTNGFYLPMQLDNTVEGFNTVTYLGTGSTQRITGVGFQPDLVWIKNRNIAGQWHVLHDSVRGAGKRLSSNDTYQEVTENALASFDTDGFTVTTGDNGYNGSSGSYVAWCWDAGSSTVSNTDGSITSSVRANPTYGFSVVTYTGNGTNGATWGHGLGVAPSMVLVKRRDGVAIGWVVGHTSIGWTNQLELSSNLASTAYNGFNSTAPTSSVITTNNSGSINGSGNNYVAYCFSEVAGFSKFGSYTGTGATGNTVTTGFKPAFVMIKRTDSTGEWVMLDNTRSPVNPARKYIYANGSSAEADAFDVVDFTDTGFTHYDGWTQTNLNGATYIYMAFKDTREYAYWLDDSGNNNDWQPNGGITTESTVTDTPTPYADGGNYAVMNPIASITTPPTFANGNLEVTGPSSGVGATQSTFGGTGGKFYVEVTVTRASDRLDLGIAGSLTASTFMTSTNYLGTDTNTIGYGTSTGVIRKDNTNNQTGLATCTTGDVVGMAIDMDSGTIQFYKNNSTVGTAVSFTPSAYGSFLVAQTTSFNTSKGTYNFGQRPFAYTPPTGFLPLHTGNLPDSAIVDGSEYFNAVTYTGNGYPTSGTQSISTVNFQPDFVWIKDRSRGGYNHFLQDVLRGSTNVLRSTTTGVENTESTAVTSFNANGFSLGANNEVNYENDAFISWNWKANGSGVSNTDGSITSTVSANPTAGFSIVTFTNPSSGSGSIGHGLGVKPSMIIVKARSNTSNWTCMHKSLGTNMADKWINLESTAAVQTSSNIWGGEPTSSVFYCGTGIQIASATMVAYCFAEVEGYSKFGKYTGTGSANGPFVYLGFRPAFVMIKSTSVGTRWIIWDAARNTYNVADKTLAPNFSAAEFVNPPYWYVDLLSNGFKVRGYQSGDTENNYPGSTYIYMAFAENPFKNSLAR